MNKRETKSRKTIRRIIGTLITIFLGLFVIFGGLPKCGGDGTGTKMAEQETNLEEENIGEPPSKSSRIQISEFQKKRILEILNGNWISRQVKLDKLLPGPCESKITFYEEDGSIKRKEKNFEQYDEHGNNIAVLIDTNNDGAPDSASRFGYDPYGKVTTFKTDEDGVIFEQKHKYNDDGNHIKSEIRRKNEQDFRPSVEKIYDDDGVLQKQRMFFIGSILSAEYFYNSEGDLAYVHYDEIEGQQEKKWKTSYTYDADLNLEKEVTIGDKQRIVTYDYDANGHRTAYYVDDEGDQKYDRIEKYQNDENGNVLKRTIDHNGDGAPDEIMLNSYDCWE